MNTWYFAIYYVEIPSKPEFKTSLSLSCFIFELIHFTEPHFGGSVGEVFRFRLERYFLY